jgi:hypothetical protein
MANRTFSSEHQTNGGFCVNSSRHRREKILEVAADNLVSNE